MMRRLRPQGDDVGAYAVLYGLLMFVVLGMAALVVDLGALRQSRRQTRLAADAAAVFGARQLDVVSGTANPRAACTDAWGYLATNLGISVPAVTGCAGFPTSALVCPLIETPVSASVGDFTVTITWPVLNDSALLGSPNAQPADSSVTTQAYDPAVDGDSPCARIAVAVEQRQQPLFASVFGAGTVPTRVTSVARSTNEPGSGGPIAALNVLERANCQAISTDGQGSIEVGSVGERQGIIAVESSGRGACGPSSQYVIDPGITSSGGHVWAGTAGTDGQILSFAMNPAPTGNPAAAYNPSAVPTILAPRPTMMLQRFGAKPVTDLYACTSACAEGGGNYIQQLRNTYGVAAAPVPYPGSPGTFSTLAFQTVSAATVPGWPGCTIGNAGLIRVPEGNWYVPCDTLSVNGVLVFEGGNVVVKGSARGGVQVGQFGCLAMNVPLPVAACPTRDALGNVVPAGRREAILYIQAGSLSKGAQASLYTERTLVYLANGVLSLSGGSTGTLYMTNPHPTDAGCAKACQNARFGRLTVWSENAEDHSIGGQVGIGLRGVLFTPNARFVWAGGSALAQTSAQLWANTLRMSGQGLLRMTPDPGDSVPRPELGTALIR